MRKLSISPLYPAIDAAAPLYFAFEDAASSVTEARAFSPGTSLDNCITQISSWLVEVQGVEHMPLSVGHQGVTLGLAGLFWLIGLGSLGWQWLNPPCLCLRVFHTQDTQQQQMFSHVYKSYYKCTGAVTLFTWFYHLLQMISWESRPLTSSVLFSVWYAHIFSFCHPSLSLCQIL